MGDKLKTVIIGAGSIAESHLYASAGLNNVRVTAIADIARAVYQSSENGSATISL